MGAESTVREAAEALIHALDRWEKTTTDHDAKIAITALMRAAKRNTLERLPTFDERRDAKRALQLGAAALGIEHE